MKRTKIFSLILIVMALIMTFTGCALFPVNTERYRGQEAIVVGDTIITLGETIEFFNTNATQYLEQGYGAQEVWDYLFPQLLTKAMFMDEQKKATANLNTGDIAKLYANGEYVSDAAIKYFQKAVQADLFQTLEEMTVEELNNKGYTFDQAKEDRAKRINKGVLTSLASEDFEKDEAALDENLLKYQAQNTLTSYDYVYTSETDPRLLATVAKLNKRISYFDPETADKKNPPKTELTVKDYINAQKTALKSLTRTIRNNYELAIADFAKRQIEENIKQEIVKLYSEKLFREVEQSADINALLQQKFENLKEQQEIKFALDSRSFVAFVNGLGSATGDDQFILTMPQEYEGEFFYVKNLLIPFSDEQTAVLTRYRNMYGSGTNDYIKARNELVKSIKLVDFENDEAETEGIFSIGYNGNVYSNELDYKIQNEDFTDLIFRYSTDVATFNSNYDYVIGRTAADKTNTGDEVFMAEFIDAARSVQDGGYAYCVTDYGVHIVMYTGEVTVQTFDWSNKYNYGTDAGSLDYRFFRNLYDSLKNSKLAEVTENMYKEFKDAGKIKITNNVLKKFLAKYSITIDQKFIKNED